MSTRGLNRARPTLGGPVSADRDARVLRFLAGPAVDGEFGQFHAQARRQPTHRGQRASDTYATTSAGTSVRVGQEQAHEPCRPKL